MELSQNLDYKSIIQNQSQIKVDEKKEQIIEYDYKIVSFRIGQEYYGINIMKVNSILKNDKFTLVPNTLDFVIGVFSLRGEILPVIDLARMFHLESTAIENQLKSVIIIKVEALLIGLVVDRIQNVIPLSKSQIQPPSPLLGKINERYIEGVSEINQKLYVILDTDAIFSDKEKIKKEILPQSSDLTEEFFTFFRNQIEEFCGIHIHNHNKSVVRNIFNDYVKEKKINEMPRINEDLAKRFLKKMLSKHTNAFWQHPYSDQFIEFLQPELEKICPEQIAVLDIGCGNGYEAYTVYFLLNDKMRDVDITMIAADSNLMSISNASRLEIDQNRISPWIDKSKYFMKISGDTYKVNKATTDKIYFEFHNALNVATYKKVFDLIIVRDFSFYVKEDKYRKFINEVEKKIKSGGLLVIGDNEKIEHQQFTWLKNDNISVYKKK